MTLSLWVFSGLSNLEQILIRISSQLCNFSKRRPEVTFSVVEKDVLKLELPSYLFPWNFSFWFPFSFYPPPPFPVRRADQEELLAAPTTTPPPLAKAATWTTSKVLFHIQCWWKRRPQSLTENTNFRVKNIRTTCSLLLIMGVELSEKKKKTLMTSP